MTFITNVELLGLLLTGHALGDRPFQPHWLGRHKNRNKAGARWWIAALSLHGGIHGLLVGLITGSTALGLAEFIAHSLTDFAKTGRRLTVMQDQIIHAACKVLWWVICLTTLSPEGLWKYL